MKASQTEMADFASPALAEALFYEAFAQLDVGLMERVWFDSEQTYCVHPGGHPLYGHRAVLESWRGMFQGAQPLVVFYKVLHQQAWDDQVIHLVEERLSSKDGSHQGLIMASNCYVRTEAGWRLFSHHGSSVNLPRKADTQPPAQVH